MSTTKDDPRSRPNRGTFCMIFGQHLCDSLLMTEEDHVFKVFITLTALSDADGVVEMSPTRLAQKLQMSREKLDDALTILSRPDPESRSTVHEGRRIIKVGETRWQVVNRKEYSSSGKYSVQKEMKSAENQTTYARRRSKGSQKSQAAVSESNESREDRGPEDLPSSSSVSEASTTSPRTAVSTPKQTSRVRFRKLSSLSGKSESGLIQPENTLTSSSTSISLSSSESNSQSTSGSPGRGESERGNRSAASMPSRQTRLPHSSEQTDPPWLTMFSDGSEEAQLKRQVDLVIASATRFAMNAEDEAQARTHVRLLCRQGMFSDVVKTIREASKGKDQSLTAFLEYYFVQELPAPAVFTIHPDEDDRDEDDDDEPRF